MKLSKLAPKPFPPPDGSARDLSQKNTKRVGGGQRGFFGLGGGPKKKTRGGGQKMSPPSASLGRHHRVSGK